MTYRIKRLLLAIFIITISSQINIDILVTNFRVSGGIIAFGIILYFYREIKPIRLTLAVSFSTFLWRSGILVLTKGYSLEGITGFIPEIFFYLLFGLIFFMLSRRNTVENENRFFLIVMLSDLSANLIEVFIHYIWFDTMPSDYVVVVLVGVAMMRSGIVWFSIKGFRYYQKIVLFEEHEKKYRRLVWLNLNLKSEVYWMAKNMDKIEETMTNAYNLFENIQNNEHPEKWADDSVQVASDVHEIKKDYELIMRGVTELTEFKFQDSGMNFKEIMKLVVYKIEKEIAQRDLNVEFHLSLQDDFYTERHYQLMSVFRNLFMNALDAMVDQETDGEEKNRMTFTHTLENDQYVFEVSDTGSGIEEMDIDQIFRPGFSTKIDYETGQINRGLGLSLVKDMIEKDFHGSIVVESNHQVGTNFVIKIPKKKLEV